MLTDQQQRQLERIKHYATRYEVRLTLPDGRAMLVCYTPRKSKAGLLDALQSRGEAILAHLPRGTEDSGLTYDNAIQGFVLGNGVSAAFSGRTQRDCILTGELPFIGACNDWAITGKAEHGPAFAV
jgi:hypothetical protein